MRGIVSLIALSVVLPPCCGCQLDTPNLAHPGTEANQQARAKVFEPYPDNEMGPPVVGGRPREYQDPRPSFAILQDMHPNPAARAAARRTARYLSATASFADADCPTPDHHPATGNLHPATGNLLSARSDAAVAVRTPYDGRRDGLPRALRRLIREPEKRDAGYSGTSHPIPIPCRNSAWPEYDVSIAPYSLLSPLLFPKPMPGPQRRKFSAKKSRDPASRPLGLPKASEQVVLSVSRAARSCPRPLAAQASAKVPADRPGSCPSPLQVADSRQAAPAASATGPGRRAPSGDRLQKVLAAAGLGSRRQCEELITTGRVEIDRKVVTQLGTRVDSATQEIRVDGESLSLGRRVYYAVNKPKGVVTTNRDPGRRPRVIDLVPNQDIRLFAIGRLDLNSEGLILVTNDGELANRLTHPRYGVEKVYLAQVAGRPTAEILDKLRRGVHLAEGVAKVEEVRIESHQKESTWLEIILREGMNREIRRLLARVGHKVLRLVRVGVGPVRLGKLPPGTVRPLLHEEIQALRSLVKNPE